MGLFYVGANFMSSSTPPTTNTGVAVQTGVVHEVSLRATPNGYSPNVLSVKQGIPVRLKFSTDKNSGCSRALVIPDFGLKTVAPSDGTPTVLEFTPTQAGEFDFYCAMAMYRGKLKVVQ